MENRQVRTFALYFFFALLNENLARQALRKAVKLSTKALASVKDDGSEQQALTVYYAQKCFRKLKKQMIKGGAQIAAAEHWRWPEDIDLGAWQQFQKDAHEEYVHAVIWSQVLGFEDSSIARGLGVTEGTVRYRTGHGLRLLGSLRRMGAGDVGF